MFDITVKDVLEATGGVLLSGSEDVQIKDVCSDSRIIKEGDIFVPLLGNNVDGHRFIESAMEVGVATFTSQHTGIVISEKPYIYVSDVLKAHQALAKYIRMNRINRIPVIGVTGSVGKTTTREMIATALSGNINTYQTEKNYNSQEGLPICIDRITRKHKVAVLEHGIDDIGKMEILSDISRPDICVITNIGLAHMERFGSIEVTRREKLSITTHMNPEGLVLLNGDNEMLAQLKGQMNEKVQFYGTAEWCDYRAENIRQENYKYFYDFVHGDTRIPVELNALGKHNVGNSIAGLAISCYMGLDLVKAAEGYKDFKGLRQTLINVPGKYTIIDDTYNASPDSMKASIDVLADLDSEGKKIAVLGDMFELGENSEQFHYEVGKYLATKNIDELVVVGELSQQYVNAVKDSDSQIKCYSFKDNGEVALYLMSVMNSEDIVLIKASNGMKLNEIVKNMQG